MESGGNIKQISWNAATASPRTRTLSVYLKETDENVLSSVKWANEIEGATLVYSSDNTWSNPSGWVTITLPKAFNYSGRNLKVMVMSLATANTDYASANCYYSVSEKRHLRWLRSANALPEGNGVLNSNRPNIRFAAEYFCGAEEPIAQFLTGIYTMEEEAEFLVGTPVAFTDLSTGPAVNYEWSFPGGIPETSREENPVVIYNQRGTYTVTLAVSNHLGSDTQQRIVTIETDPPAVGFSSSSTGFTTYPAYGQFLSAATGGAVSLKDESINSTQWEWSLEGVDPGTYTDNEVTVNYPVGENAYDVDLSVVVDAIVNTKQIKDYVKVGGTSKIWNIPYLDKGISQYKLAGNFYITGTNTDYPIIAEKFSGMKKGSISQVDVMLKVITESGLDAKTFTVSVYNEIEGKPGDVLSSVQFKGTVLNRSGYTNVVFPEPVVVSGNFYIAIDGFNNSASQVVIPSSQHSAPTVYVFKNQEWLALKEVDPNHRELSLNVVPTYTDLGGTSGIEKPAIPASSVNVYPNPVDHFLSIRSETPIEKVFIQDMQGRQLSVMTVSGKEEITIPTSTLVKGTYIVRIQTKTDILNYKILKR
jgi:PKD repeat protein